MEESLGWRLLTCCRDNRRSSRFLSFRVIWAETEKKTRRAIVNFFRRTSRAADKSLNFSPPNTFAQGAKLTRSLSSWQTEDTECVCLCVCKAEINPDPPEQTTLASTLTRQNVKIWFIFGFLLLKSSIVSRWKNIQKDKDDISSIWMEWFFQTFNLAASSCHPHDFVWVCVSPAKLKVGKTFEIGERGRSFRGCLLAFTFHEPPVSILLIRCVCSGR